MPPALTVVGLPGLALWMVAFLLAGALAPPGALGVARVGLAAAALPTAGLPAADGDLGTGLPSGLVGLFCSIRPWLAGRFGGAFSRFDSSISACR